MIVDARYSVGELVTIHLSEQSRESLNRLADAQMHLSECYRLSYRVQKISAVRMFADNSPAYIIKLDEQSSCGYVRAIAFSDRDIRPYMA